MKALENEAVNDLIYFYSSYIKNGLNDKLKEKAITIESKYLSASPLLSDIIIIGVNKLVDFYANTGIDHISQNEAENRLKNLKEFKKTLKDSQRNKDERT